MDGSTATMTGPEVGTPASARSSHSDLLAALGGCLDVVTQAVALTTAGSSPLTPKVCAEAALVAHVVATTLNAAPECRPALAAPLARLREQLDPTWSETSVAVAVTLDPGHALDHAVVPLLLGTATPRLRAAVRRAVAHGHEPELLPHRRLERHWLGRLAGCPPDPHEHHDLRTSALGRPLDVLAGTRLEHYAFTHAVMYASQLGDRPIEPARPAADVLHDAEAALGCALDDGDLDLAGELLLSWPLLRGEWTTAASCGVHRLLAAHAAHGLLPSRSFDPLADPERRILAAYHATSVLALVLALALRRPPPPWTASEQDRAVAAALGLPAATGPDVLAAPLAVAAQLRSAAQRGDLAGLRRIATTAVEHDVCAPSSLGQTLAVLQRIGALRADFAAL